MMTTPEHPCGPLWCLAVWCVGVVRPKFPCRGQAGGQGYSRPDQPRAARAGWDCQTLSVAMSAGDLGPSQSD